jgi:ribonuclease T1
VKSLSQAVGAMAARGLIAALLWLFCAAAGAADLPGVALSELPREARATLVLIQRGGPFPYRRDGMVFRNFERILPTQPRGYYREYTVTTPGVRDRGARRIVAGAGPRGDVRTSGEYYYTDDHYNSFRRIELGRAARE